MVSRQSIPRWRWFFGYPRPFVPGHAKRISYAKRLVDHPTIRRGWNGEFPDLTPRQAAYFAGILDGEGTISTHGRTVTISIANTSWPLIEWLLFFGGSSYVQKTPAHRRPVWRWQIRRRGMVARLLMQLLPDMIIKRDLAAAALTLIKDLP